jgi:hypothetical protein
LLLLMGWWLLLLRLLLLRLLLLRLLLLLAEEVRHWGLWSRRQSSRHAFSSRQGEQVSRQAC